MARGWRQFLEENQHIEKLSRTEKIRRGKRSVRGRTVDDWILSTVDAENLLAAAQTTRATSAAEVASGVGVRDFTGFRMGRVIEVHKRNIFVADETVLGQPKTEELWLCSIAKRHFQRAHKERNFVVVGDRVLFEPDVSVEFDDGGEPVNSDLPRGAIQHAIERTSQIARRDPMNPDWEHVMLANIDVVAIVASVLNPEVRWSLIDRFLVQAELESLPAIIVLNKADLLTTNKQASPEFLERYTRRRDILRTVGYKVIEVCALKPKKTPEGVAELKAIFRGKLVGLCGHSGVGKSSLLNLMRPEFDQIVDENPEIFYKGRHTTTYNSLLRLGIGGYAIDTPGIRSFAIEGFDPITLARCFPEFAPERSGFRCKYRECAHDVEPDCGVKLAVAAGTISPERYRSYQGILKGVSLREGEGDTADAEIIADLKARKQDVDRGSET